MKLRYKTTGPGMIWHDDLKAQLPASIEGAKNELIAHCQEYFGSQFYRYDSIVISVMQGSETLFDLTLDPLVLLSTDQAVDVYAPDRSAA